jgi:hypothetical protein
MGAVVLLLLNDHVLRWNWPSWWTGKLGDFAWLLFAPFLVMAALALIPRHGEWRAPWGEDRIALAGFALTGLVFALMKTLPAAHQAGLRALSWLVGAPFTLRRDPSDLLALVALPLAWWVWRVSARAADRRPAYGGWVVLAVGALASVANSPLPFAPLDCLIKLPDGTIQVTHSRGGVLYETEDGGLSWSLATEFRELQNEYWGDCSPEQTPGSQSWQFTIPDDPLIVYRFTPGRMIERSEDGGQTWKRELNVSVSEAEETYYRNAMNRFGFITGPLDAIVDDSTGNLIVAMGFQGVLIRTDDGHWTWVAIGDHFFRVRMWQPQIVFKLLLVEFILATAVLPLMGGTLSLHIRKAHAFRFVLQLIAWGFWLSMVIFSPALVFPSYGVGLVLVYYFPLVLIAALITGIWGLVITLRHSSEVARFIWKQAGLSILFFTVPYIAWAENLLPRYILAMILALIFTAGSVYINSRRLKELLTSDQTIETSKE